MGTFITQRVQNMRKTYQLQDRDLHHTLVEVRRFVLHYLDRNYLMSLHVLALDYLSKCSLAQNIQNQVSGHLTGVSGRPH